MLPENKVEMCEGCAWWQGTIQDGNSRYLIGECRYAPPVMQTDGRRGYWPQTLDTEWCHSFFPVFHPQDATKDRQ